MLFLRVSATCSVLRPSPQASTVMATIKEEFKSGSQVCLPVKGAPEWERGSVWSQASTALLEVASEWGTGERDPTATGTHGERAGCSRAFQKMQRGGTSRTRDGTLQPAGPRALQPVPGAPPSPPPHSAAPPLLFLLPLFWMISFFPSCSGPSSRL